VEKHSATRIVTNGVGQPSHSRATKAPANPDLRVPFIVRLLEPPSVADDRPVAAERAELAKASAAVDVSILK